MKAPTLKHLVLLIENPWDTHLYAIVLGLNRMGKRVRAIPIATCYNYQALTSWTSLRSKLMLLPSINGPRFVSNICLSSMQALLFNIISNSNKSFGDICQVLPSAVAQTAHFFKPRSP